MGPADPKPTAGRKGPRIQAAGMAAGTTTYATARRAVPGRINIKNFFITVTDAKSVQAIVREVCGRNRDGGVVRWHWQIGGAQVEVHLM